MYVYRMSLYINEKGKAYKLQGYMVCGVDMNYIYMCYGMSLDMRPWYVNV